MIINCWDTRVQSYPTSARKIKNINCRPGHLNTLCLWQMFEIFVVHSEDSKLKAFFFLFFKILIRYWETGVQNYLTSACKIFGVARKRRVPAEKCSYRSTKRLKCLYQEDWSKRGVPATSTRWPNHLNRQFLTTASNIHTAPKIPQPNIPRLFIHIPLCVSVSESVCVCVCV